LRAFSAATVANMEQARKVLTRLRRIEALDRERASAPALLAEVRALLAEAEEWVRAEPGGTDLAEDALERCRQALRAPAVPR
jgi:hypothetical protein